jgi:hypothetical protein
MIAVCDIGLGRWTRDADRGLRFLDGELLDYLAAVSGELDMSMS